MRSRRTWCRPRRSTSAASAPASRRPARSARLTCAAGASWSSAPATARSSRCASRKSAPPARAEARTAPGRVAWGPERVAVEQRPVVEERHGLGVLVDHHAWSPPLAPDRCLTECEGYEQPEQPDTGSEPGAGQPGAGQPGALHEGQSRRHLRRGARLDLRRGGGVLPRGGGHADRRGAGQRGQLAGRRDLQRPAVVDPQPGAAFGATSAWHPDRAPRAARTRLARLAALAAAPPGDTVAGRRRGRAVDVRHRDRRRHRHRGRDPQAARGGARWPRRGERAHLGGRRPGLERSAPGRPAARALVVDRRARGQRPVEPQLDLDLGLGWPERAAAQLHLTGGHHQHPHAHHHPHALHTAALHQIAGRRRARGPPRDAMAAAWRVYWRSPGSARRYRQATRAGTAHQSAGQGSFPRQLGPHNPVRRRPVRSTLEPVAPTKVKISVVVEPDELGPAIERTARRLSREGKVPRPVLEARIGREALIAEAIEHEAVPEFYAKAVEELGVEPLSRGKVEPPDYKDGQPLEFSATVEVKPRIDLPPYRGVEVERPEIEVTDKHLDTQLDQLRERFAQLEVIGRPIAKGDFLRFNGTLPEEAGELAGQEVTFTVLVKEAKSKVLPALDDDFAQEASEFDTLDELRAHLRERLEEAATGQVRSELETRVFDTFLGQVDVPLPETLVNDELQFRASRFVQQLNLMGISLEQYQQGAETTREQLEADLRAQAERAVKAQLVLEAVAAAEGIEASDEEVEAEIGRQAQRLGREPGDVRKALGAGRDGVIRGDILRTKALELLVENADVAVQQGGGEAETVGAAGAPDGDDEQAPKE